MKSVNRRFVLKGLMGCTLALPYLESLAAKNSNNVPTRLFCMGTSFGFVPKIFFPKEKGKNYKSTLLLKELDQHKDSFTTFSNLDHGLTGGHQAVHTYLSGIKARDAKNMKEGNISIDQKAAASVGAKTRYQSMQFTSGENLYNRLSWTTAGVAIPPIKSLNSIFSSLFVNLAPKYVTKAQHRLNSEISIIDLVQRDAKDLHKKISKEDNEKLDQYFTSLREVEKKLQMSKNWVNKTKPKVSYKLPSDIDSELFVDRVPVYYDLIALALQTDSTRVISFEVSDLGSGLGGLKIERGYHALTHHGKVPSFLDGLAVIEKFHLSQVSRFFTKLKNIKESNGKSLYDNTISLIGSGMGNSSSHSNKNLPLIVAGGDFKHQGHMICPKVGKDNTPACNLYLTLLQRFGLEIDKFNLSKSTLTGFGV